MSQETNQSPVEVGERDGHPREGQRSGWRRRLLFPLISLVLGTLVSVAAGEAVLRMFVDQEAKRLATYDETLGWRGRPNGHGVYIRKVDGIRVPFQYNNLGFRDEDVGPKTSNGRRILMLGDSFIENLEVEYAKTFPALLEQLVTKRSPAWDVAVVGSQGYSTSQELLAFRSYRDLVSADVVLLCFYCGNDFEDNLRRKFSYLDDDGELQIPTNQEPTWKHIARSAQRWLYESSHVVFLLKNSLQSIANINLAPDSKSVAKADLAYQRKITEKLLIKLAEEVRASGAKFGVVVIPFRDDLVAGDQQAQSFVTSVCDEHKIPFLDLSPLLDRDDFFETDIHFNVGGHKTVAHAINDFIATSLNLEGKYHHAGQ